MTEVEFKYGKMCATVDLALEYLEQIKATKNKAARDMLLEMLEGVLKRGQLVTHERTTREQATKKS